MAVGLPFENDGIIDVLYGSSFGLLVEERRKLDSWGGNITRVGSILNSGDLNGDGKDDLVIGVPLAEVVFPGAGAVIVVYGSSTGLNIGSRQLWLQNQLQGIVETRDHFGASLAVGDFNSDGRADLAVGAPGEDNSAGAVHVIYGSAQGLTTAGNQLWTQDSADIAGVPEIADKFGQSLAAGNVGKTTHADLAIGVPGENIGTGNSAGVVNIIYGSGTGLKRRRKSTVVAEHAGSGGWCGSG